MKLSARNTLKGNVVQGAVNTEVTVQLAGGEQIVSIITRHSAESMALAEGSEVCAVVNASNVIIAM